MAWTLLLVTLLYCICNREVVEGKTIYFPNNGSTLGHYLCERSSPVNEPSNTVFVLDSSTTHVVEAKEALCVIKGAMNIVIKSESQDRFSTIECIGNDTVSNGTSGFAFLNSANITINNVVFSGCGGTLGSHLSDALDLVRRDVYYKFDVLNCVTLMFINSSQITLGNILITNYTGFGLVFINSQGITKMESISITNAADCNNNEIDITCTGSGLLVINDNDHENTFMNLENVIVTNGYTTEFNDSLVEQIDSGATPSFINVAAGISIVIRELAGSDYSVNITMDNLLVYNNRGGGMILVYVNVVNSSITIDSANISSCLPGGLNAQNRIGESLTVYYALTEPRYELFDYNSLTLHDVTFAALISDSCRSKYGNLSDKGYKAFNLTSVLVRAIGDYVSTRSIINHKQKILLSDILFMKNFPGITHKELGIGMYVYSYDSIVMTLHNVTAKNFSCSDSGYDPNNSYYSCENVGSLAFSNMKKLEVVDGLFTGHRGCSAFYVQNSKVNFTGNVTISNNHGVIYGALNIIRSSQINLVEPLMLVMENNHAQLGAAIYTNDQYNDICAIQFIPLHYYDSDNYTLMDITLKISNNTADLSGNTIYSYPLHHCSHTMFGSSPSSPTLFTILLKKTNPMQNRTTKEISSPASLICLCEYQNDTYKLPELPCDKSQTHYYDKIYSGRKIKVYMVASDETASVYGTVRARFVNVPINVSVRLAQQEISSSVAAGQCTGVDYTIYHNAETDTNVTLELAAISHTSNVFLNLTLVNCSNGLYLSDDSGSCECLNVYKAFGCINGTIKRLDEYWVGFTSNKQYGYSTVCPSGFCNDSISSVSISTNLDEPSPMCNGGRTGTLCTSCPKGKSIVFGSVNCQECSNWYIATVLFYCVCGILLVTMIFILQLTVRVGTINGLIFYANLLSTGFTLGYLLQVDSNLYLLRVFVSFINLNLGFPLCFYDGMNEEVNRLLQFVFPVYVWIIIGTIIVASRHSIKLSNWTGKHSVAVLATLLQLSYSKIMANIVESFPKTIITMQHTTDQDLTYLNVWFFAGVDYNSLLHILHMLVSIALLLLFIIPYTLIITFAPFLAKYHIFSSYKPFLDTVYAPYKEKWRCWFGVRLCLLVVLLICNASLLGYSFKINLGVQMVSVIGFVFLQVHFKPFKNLFIHLVDVFFMLNFCACTFFSIALEDGSTLFRIITFLVATAFLAFFGIIVYHIYFVFLEKSALFVMICHKMPKHSKKPDEVSLSSSVPSYCKHGTFDRLREPILDYCDDFNEQS